MVRTRVSTGGWRQYVTEIYKLLLSTGMVENLQVVGASNMLRLLQKEGAEVEYFKDSATEKVKRKIGACVAGHTIQQTYNQLKRMEYSAKLLNNLALLVGVNDIVRGGDLKKMKLRMKGLLRFLVFRNKKVFLITIPPFRRIVGNGESRDKLTAGITTCAKNPKLHRALVVGRECLSWTLLQWHLGAGIFTKEMVFISLGKA
ncbi:uncharacterized protein LOC134527822 [Bacillus rossius redtenbacheri]|uniref:uncharacterized protein LOC134527822 n=1 Tax=Bacillus rossius redtenbacheri TaxID=93214 RepID=UPI002FDC92B7